MDSGAFGFVILLAISPLILLAAVVGFALVFFFVFVVVGGGVALSSHLLSRREHADQ